MNNIRSFLLIAIVSITPLFLSAQDQFDRLYRTNDREMIGLSMEVDEGGSFYLLSYFRADDVEENGMGYNVTKLMPKGDVDWSSDYFIEDTLQITPYGDLIISNEGIVINGMVSDTSLKTNKVTIRLNGGGSVEWAKGFSGPVVDSVYTGPIFLSDLHDVSFTQFGTVKDESGRAVYASRIDDEGEIIWSQSFDIVDTLLGEMDERPAGVISGGDTTIVSVGTIESGNTAIYLQKLDTNGVMLWSRKYFTPPDTNLTIGAYDLAELPDTSYVITGFYFDRSRFKVDGLVMRVDSLGNILWSKRISFGEFFVSALSSHIEILEDGNLLISGSYNNPVLGDNNEYLLKISPGGIPIWQWQYSKIAPRFHEAGGLSAMSDNQAAYFTTAIDTVQEDSTKFYPRLIKVDADGLTSCEDSLNLDLLFDIVLNQDTLIWETAAEDSIVDLVISASPFGQYDIPILTLRDTSYCPGDPVMFLLDATVQGAVSYIWTRADQPGQILGTDSIFIATEIDVQYIATVRVEDEFCMTLCDTTNITEIDPPEVSILPNFAGYCENRDVQLFVQASGQIDSIAWSTGETNTGFITLTDPAIPSTYSVTVTNQCGDTGEAQINITEALLPPDEPIIIQKSDIDLCTTGELRLIFENFNLFSNVVWSTGETGPSISVATPGEYTVMAVDDCMYPVERVINVFDLDFLEEVNLSLDPDLDNCVNGVIQIRLVGTGVLQSIIWSDGTQNQSMISVTEPGIYEVEVIDICGDMFVLSTEITLQQLFECGREIGEPCPDDPDNCLCYPSVFRPSSMVDLNATFGPDNRCPEITEYLLRIYNRWGQKVFESTDISMEWDGRKNGEALQGDVYVYYAIYTSEGVEFQTKGDVTLIR